MKFTAWGQEFESPEGFSLLNIDPEGSVFLRHVSGKLARVSHLHFKADGRQDFRQASINYDCAKALHELAKEASQ